MKGLLKQCLEGFIEFQVSNYSNTVNTRSSAGGSSALQTNGPIYNQIEAHNILYKYIVVYCINIIYKIYKIYVLYTLLQTFKLSIQKNHCYM